MISSDEYLTSPEKVEPIAKMLQASSNISVLEPSESSHYGTLTGTSRSMRFGRIANARGSGPPCSMHDSAILREPLCNLGGLGDTTSFRNQARDIGTRGEKATFGQWLDMESDCRFVHSVCLFNKRIKLGTRLSWR